MRIATMATGGIGGFLAFKLVKGGHQVATIARGQHLDAIVENGLALDGPEGSESIRPWGLRRMIPHGSGKLTRSSSVSKAMG